MQPLDALASEALELGNGVGQGGGVSVQDEAARQLQVCNACRYCEGFCAMFPAMTQRLMFEQADVHYLANLCHNCGACLHACQYAPPHEFAINIPRVMAQVRGETYKKYAWPGALGRLYQRNGLTLVLALTAALAVFLMLAASTAGGLWGNTFNGNFYSVFPHSLLVWMFAPVFLYAVLALGMGVRNFLGLVGPATGGKPVDAPAAFAAAGDALTLKYLDGGHGQGCNNEDDAFTLARRRFHHFVFYGFGLCFAATALGTLYHYVMGWQAPYDLPSLPKVLGALGGLSLLAGTVGLGRLNIRRHPLHGDPAQKPMDLGFIALLFLISASGLAVWLLRSSPAMAILLCVHLAAVMALFLTMPYGKFAHGFYRLAALARYAVEKRRTQSANH
jgi:citrate/tricarballylate utilization protein